MIPRVRNVPAFRSFQFCWSVQPRGCLELRVGIGVSWSLLSLPGAFFYLGHSRFLFTQAEKRNKKLLTYNVSIFPISIFRIFESVILVIMVTTCTNVARNSLGPLTVFLIVFGPSDALW